MPEIGATLRETRMRARIDISEIEAQTKIRAKYLRALENEEWDLLPGPTFVKSFLRTYARALGLDERTLVEEYRLNHEPPSEIELQPIASAPTRRRTGLPRAGASRGFLIAVGAVVGVIVLLFVLLVVGLLAGGGGSSHKRGAPSHSATKSHRRAHATTQVAPTSIFHSKPVALSLEPSARVYVCLIGDNGRKLIPGLELQPTYTPVTYHATRFQITLGNSSIRMHVDGKAETVPPSNQAIGYSITSAGRHTLPARQLPTCL